MTSAAQYENPSSDKCQPQVTEAAVMSETPGSSLCPHVESTSDNDAGERPVREKLKKTSIASIPKSTVTPTQEDNKNPVDHSMSIQNSETYSSSNITVNGDDDRGRPIRKRSLDDREATSGEKSTHTVDGHARKRSRDIRAGQAAKADVRKHEHPDHVLPEENEDPDNKNSVSGPCGEDEKASTAMGTPPSDPEIVDHEMHESIFSPRKKRSRDQFEAESQREQKIAATDETRVRRQSSEIKRHELSSTKDENLPSTEVNGQNEATAIPTGSPDRTSSATLPTKVPPLSGFSNFSVESPFSNLARTTSSGKPFVSSVSNGQTQTSSSAFSSSGFAALAASSTSPFGSLGATSVSSSKSPPSNLPQDTSKLPFPTLSPSKTEQSKPSGFGPSFAGTGQSSFNTSAISGFGTLKSTSNAGFGGKFGGDTKLSSFAAPVGDTKFGGGPPKPFGASADSEDEDKDSDTGSGNEDEEKDQERSEADPKYHKQDTDTGEEREDTIFQVRGKLFEFTGKEWAERGVGLFKLNVARMTSEEGEKVKARFIMRVHLTYRVVLNTRIFKEMPIGDGTCNAPTGKSLMFSAVKGGQKPTPYMLRVGKEEDIKTLYREVKRLQEEL